MTSTQATETYVDALRVIYDEAHTALETVRIQLREKRVDVPTLMQAVKAVNKAKKMAASDDETKDDDLLKKIALLVIVEDHYIERLTRSILSDERLTTTNFTDFWNEYNFCMYGPKYATPPPGEHMHNGIKYIYRKKTNSQLYNDTSTSLVDACMLHEAFEKAHEAIMKVKEELKKTKQVDNILIRAVTAINVAKELVVRRTSEAKKRAITPVSKDVQNDEKMAQNIEGKIKLLDIVIKSMVDALQDDSKTKEDDSKTKEDNDNGNDDSDDDSDDNDDNDDDDDYSNQIPVDPRYLFMDQFVYAQEAYKQNPSLKALDKIQTTYAKMNEEGIFMIN